MQKTVLLPFIFLLNLSAQHLSGQSKIYGEVFVLEKPLMGVQVNVEGTGQVVETDTNGVFILNGINGEYKLCFTWQDFNAVSDDLFASKGNLVVNLFLNINRLNINYSEYLAEELISVRATVSKLKDEQYEKMAAFEQLSSEVIALYDQHRVQETELLTLKKKIGDNRFGVTENDVSLKKIEVEKYEKKLQNKKAEVSKYSKDLEIIRQKINQKENVVENMLKKYNKSKEIRKKKFETAEALLTEKVFLEGLPVLELDKSVIHVEKEYSTEILFPKGFYDQPNLTFDKIAQRVRKCVLEESKFKARVEYFWCDKGVAITVFPHPIDINGDTVTYPIDPNTMIPVVHKNPFDALINPNKRVKGYSRIIIFLFSTTGPGSFPPPSVTHSDIPGSLARNGYTQDDTTLLYTGRQKMPCTVYVYMYEHLDIEHWNPKPINNISAEQHLRKTNLEAHLIEYH